MTDDARAQWLAPAVLLGLATAVGYAVAFMFEVGRASAYGIPEEMVTVDLPTVCMAVLALFTLFLAYAILNVITSGRSGPVRARIRAMLPTLSLVLVGLVFGGSLRLFAALVGAFVLALEFGFPLLTQRGKGSYVQKLDAHDDHETAKGTAAIDLLIRALGRRAARTVTWILGLPLCALVVGFGFAEGRTDFFVTADEPRLVLLRPYGETLVFAEFDADTKTIGNLVVRKLDAGQALTLERRRVGPLRRSR